ncbi:hypothetical protein FRZ44_06100 [Hypericibacter terrae]|uniref:Lipoprotein n=1 Tax=Hypericibacter terrae TaxID=2602015 RepID=A0A5J6ME86_9PROT|nr:hypothetical protein [Hypericibacter terrae]QEX15327.1 hypothetical protein FRZ44_06100 [Hypericibacter terrae]
MKRFSTQRFLGVVLVLAGGLLAACDTPPHRDPFPQLTYAHLGPINLDVAQIAIVDAYQPPMADPHVEQDFPTPPAAAARQWAQDRLKAVGSDGVAKYTITDGSAIDVPLPRTTGLDGMITQDQSDRYDVTVTVRLDLENRMGNHRGSITATAKRSETAAEDMTLNEREKLWFEMTDQLMKQLNAELEKQIGRNLKDFVR